MKIIFLTHATSHQFSVNVKICYTTHEFYIFFKLHECLGIYLFTVRIQENHIM